MLSTNQRQLILSYKELQKSRALRIRALKDEMKTGMRGGETTNQPWRIQGQLLPTAKYEYRHMHIALCMLRGRTWDEIEKGGDHSHNPDLLQSLMKEFKEKFDAAA